MIVVTTDVGYFCGVAIRLAFILTYKLRSSFVQPLSVRTVTHIFFSKYHVASVIVDFAFGLVYVKTVHSVCP